MNFKLNVEETNIEMYIGKMNNSNYHKLYISFFTNTY